VEIDRDTDLPLALRAALDKGRAAVELIYREGRIFTSQGHLAPAVFGDPPAWKLNPGDVVVISGGATGSAPPGPRFGALRASPGLSRQDPAGSIGP